MKRNTLILSDAHLSTILPDTEPGMNHRKEAAIFDEEMASLIDRAVIRSRRVPLSIVFNGDLFDFDAPPGCFSEFLPDTISHEQSGAVQTLQAILEDHPIFLKALGRALCNGHSVVFVAGNHDAQLAFPEVRGLLRLYLTLEASLYKANCTPQIFFRSLFHQTSDGLHIEHGHSYDPFCALSVPLPFARDGQSHLEETVGSVASYYGPAVLRDVDPYKSNPMDVRSHDLATAVWQRIAAGDISAPWLMASATRFIHRLAMVDAVADARGTVPFCEHVAGEVGRHVADITRHVAMFAPKAVATRALEANIRSNYGTDVDDRLRAAMREICAIYNCRGVVFGHTHVPWIGGHGSAQMANSGAWSHTQAGSYVWAESDSGVFKSFSCATTESNFL